MKRGPDKSIRFPWYPDNVCSCELRTDNYIKKFLVRMLEFPYFTQIKTYHFRNWIPRFSKLSINFSNQNLQYPEIKEPNYRINEAYFSSRVHWACCPLSSSKKSKTYAKASKLELLSSLDEHYNFNNVIKTWQWL